MQKAIGKSVCFQRHAKKGPQHKCVTDIGADRPLYYSWAFHCFPAKRDTLQYTVLLFVGFPIRGFARKASNHKNMHDSCLLHATKRPHAKFVLFPMTTAHVKTIHTRKHTRKTTTSKWEYAKVLEKYIFCP